MNKNVLNTVAQKFIDENLNIDIAKLLFQKSPFKHVSTKTLVEQIEAKKKCKTKLPSWFSSNQIYYPNKLNIAQTSSEVTAAYKSQLVSGESLIDITGGFGVDAYYFSKQIRNVTHCEINTELADIVNHNFNALDIHNIVCANTDGVAFVINNSTNYDWVYVDPSRRHDSKGKVFFLADCLPNIPEHLDVLFEHTENIMIKTSPLLDIRAGINELQSAKEIHIIAVNNDVKELLWILSKNYTGTIAIKTVNLKKDNAQEFDFYLNNEKIASPSYSEPLNFLYEPNAALLKSGAFKLTSERLKVHKISTNTHLYTSENLTAFPGRSFKIEKTIAYNKKLLKKEFMYNTANISSRNFPESVDQLKHKFKLGDGGLHYLFFTTDKNNQKIVLVCTKI